MARKPLPDEMKSGEMPSAYARIQPHTTPIRVAMDCKNPLAFRLITKITAVVIRKTARNFGWIVLYPEEIPVAPLMTVALICITMRIRNVPFTIGVNTLRGLLGALAVVVVDRGENGALGHRLRAQPVI